MELSQTKLTKSEWDGIEIPVSESEVNVLNLLVAGYHDVNIRINQHNSLFSFLKIEYSEKMEDYLFNKYFREDITAMIAKYSVNFLDISKISENVQIKSADKIRLDRNDVTNVKKSKIYEYVLLNEVNYILKSKYGRSSPSEKDFIVSYYTLHKLIRNNVSKINRHVVNIVNTILNKYLENVEIIKLIEYGVLCIEKNNSILKYGDMVLYDHQKQIFSICKNPKPKLILYIAPTGTGKTLTPIGLSEQYKVIFVCAARHVGLALARAAIAIKKKIAFAFGCSSADDIRLHYYAAREFTVNKRTGGIKKVDNSVGYDVEIIISDIKSYIASMYYMLAFNSAEKIYVYWDEPTITLDYENHEFHQIIKRNWSENIIPNMILSSATLPKLHELTETVSDFTNKFQGAQVYNIESVDCKKSIPLINNDGYVVLPHMMSIEYEQVQKIAQHCERNPSILRYLDLKEVIDFIIYVVQNNFTNSKMRLNRHFETIDDIDMKIIKTYYIKLLQNILEGTWGAIYTYFKSVRAQRISNNFKVDSKGNKIEKTRSIGPGVSVSSSSMSGKPISRMVSEQVLPTQQIIETGNCGVYVTTKDAFTLTDGPTLFLTNDVEKIARFCIQQANIPVKVMDDLIEKIEFNNKLNGKLNELEKELEDINIKNEKNGSGGKESRKINREIEDEVAANKAGTNRIHDEINRIRSQIKTTVLNEIFVPNKMHHINKWAPEPDENSKTAFTSDIEETVVNNIMLLHGVKDSWKVLLMMGIGVFTEQENKAYMEIMKRLADEQKLYLIIASSDYIYGTNYQFCHGYLSKDLKLTQEKIIQALGRVGRNNIQQNYSLRFRDMEHINKLFTNETEKPEIINMNVLFNSNKVRWNGDTYEQFE